MAVNLSTRSLLDASLPEAVRSALARWHVPPHLLDLEITETIIMTDPARARRVLTELAAHGRDPVDRRLRHRATRRWPTCATCRSIS